MVERVARRQVKEAVMPVLGQVMSRGAPTCRAAVVQPATLCGLARKLGLPTFVVGVVPLLLQLLLSPQHHASNVSSSVLQVCRLLRIQDSRTLYYRLNCVQTL